MTTGCDEPNMHGGDLDAARAAYPNAPAPWIDLSTGINPFAYPVPALDAAACARLPQRSEQEALCRAAADRYGADHPGMITAAPGTQALIQIIPRLVDRARVAIVSPTYSEHALAWKREGHDVSLVTHVYEAGGADVVVVVNPNNPTGHLTPTPALRKLAEMLHARSGLLVVDEAFADVAANDVSIIPGLPPSTIVLRSFGKAYGLPGLRLGFAVSHIQMASLLRDRLGPWCVSTPAIAIGTRALADGDWLGAATANLESTSHRLDALLSACDCTLLGGTPLFRLVSHPRASAIADALGNAGILVRRFADFPEWLRFGLPGSEEAWQRLSVALHAAADKFAVVRCGMEMWPSS